MDEIMNEEIIEAKELFYLNLDEDGYLLSVSSADVGGPSVESLDGLDLSGNRIMAYKWDGESLILDEDRLAELEKENTGTDEVPVSAYDVLKVLLGVSE